MWVIPIILFGLYLRISFFNVSVSSLPTITDEALNMLMAKNIGSFPLLFWTQPYQFPLEAYILSLFVDFLPNDAFGARIVLAVICWASLLGFSWLAFKEKEGRFLGILLVSVPSAYFLMRQSGILIPQYTLTITFAWLLPLLLYYSRFFLGFISGLALSIHLLSIPIVVGVTSFVLFSYGRWRYLFGASLGLLPYLLTMQSHGAVTETISISEGFNRLVSDIVPNTLPAVAGAMPPIFPDWPLLLQSYQFLSVPFQIIFISLLMLSLIVRALHVLKMRALEVKDSLLIAIFVSLITASFAEFGVKYRYLLPVAIYFPFLITTSLGLFKNKGWKFFITFLGIGVAVTNYQSSIQVRNDWSKPGFSKNIPRNPKLEPLFSKLKELDIKFCYSSWWNVYQITWESGGAIRCSQVYNERFPGWPLTPYHSKVKAAQKVGYVLLDNREHGLNLESFKATLADHKISYKRESISDFHIFYDFYFGDLKPKSVIKHLTLKEELFSFERPIKGILFYSDSTKKSFPDISISIKDGEIWKTLYKRSIGVIYDLNLGYKETDQTTQFFSIPAATELKITVHGNRKIDEMIFYE